MYQAIYVASITNVSYSVLPVKIAPSKKFPQLQKVQISNLSSKIIIAAKGSDIMLCHTPILISRANHEI